MEAVKDTCAFCGKEIVITDPKAIASLKTCKGKDKCTKLYCSDECRRKAMPKSMEGSLDINELFS